MVVWRTVAESVAELANGRSLITVDSEPWEQPVQSRSWLDIAAVADDDIAVFLYAPGTTGRPKGAMLTHRNMRTNAQLVVELFKITHDDILFGGLPFFYVFGQTVAVNAVAAAGASVALMERFHPVEAIDVLEREQVSLVAAVPSMHIAMLQEVTNRQVEHFPHIRGLISGGSALPVEVLKRAEKVFDAPVLEGYGLSETSPVVCFNHLDGPRAPGSIGVPVRGAHMRIVDVSEQEVPPGEVGEIVISGQYVMAGYWHREEATAEAIRDGWFHSGDLGRCDDDGLFYMRWSHERHDYPGWIQRLPT